MSSNIGLEPLRHPPLLRRIRVGERLGLRVVRRPGDPCQQLVGGDLEMLVRVRVRRSLPGVSGCDRAKTRNPLPPAAITGPSSATATRPALEPLADQPLVGLRLAQVLGERRRQAVVAG